MPPSPRGPAYRIETERLVLRCFEPADAPALKRAIDASLGALVPWLAWARDEPQSVEAKVELLRGFRARFDLGRDFFYGLFDPAGEAVLGGAGLHGRGRRARSIGYWVHAEHVGQGLACEAAAALVRVGFEVLALERVDLGCDPANERSAAVARKLGFVHDATLRARTRRRDGSRADRMVFSMLREDYERSICSQARLLALDALGRTLLDTRQAGSAGSSGPSRPRSAFR